MPRTLLAPDLFSITMGCPRAFTNQPMEDLACELVEHARAGIKRVYFCSGGAEAVEAVLKLARSINEVIAAK